MLSHRSPLGIVRLWHGLFDGTRGCRCARSRRYQAAIAAEYAREVTGGGL